MYGEQMIIQETELSFCMKMKHKLEKLERTGKLTLSDDIRREQNVLDLKKESFNAGCRKVTGKNN